jgi:hypothetical protein
MPTSEAKDAAGAAFMTRWGSVIEVTSGTADERETVPSTV